MTFHVKQGAVAKTITDCWVKQGGVVKQFFTRVAEEIFSIYRNGVPTGNLWVYDYPFPTYGTAVDVRGYDDGTGPYEFSWTMPVANNNVVWTTATDGVSVGFDISVPFEGTLRCDITGTGAGGVTRTRLLQIVVSPNEVP